MKVLITGASGHLGGHTVKLAEAAGHTVHALVRASSNLKGLEGTKAQLFYGDVLDADSVKAAAAGCDAIIHQAAVFRTDLDKPEDIIKPAVEGTRNVLDAAKAHGIKRVVYTSSIAAIGMGTTPERIFTGRDWNTDLRMPYIEAKTRSEQLAHEMARAYGLELVVICPTGISGPGDYRLTPTQRMALGMLTGQMPRRVGGNNLVHVTDVAGLHVQALTRGQSFGRYIAAGENVTYDQIAELLERIVGHALPPAPPAPAGMPALYTWYDISDTQRDFDYQPVPAEKVLKSVVEWYKTLGVYPPQT